MINNVIYKVAMMGGMDGMKYIEEFYNTKGAAFEAIRKQNWNDVTGLYEINIKVDENGKLVAEGNRVARPHTAEERKLNRENENENYVD